MTTLKLVELSTNLDGSKQYDETEYYPPGGLLFVWDDILFLANEWGRESRLNTYSVNLHRNQDGYPTAVLKSDEEVKLILGAVKSNSHGFRLQSTEGNF